MRRGRPAASRVHPAAPPAIGGRDPRPGDRARLTLRGLRVRARVISVEGRTITLWLSPRSRGLDLEFPRRFKIRVGSGDATYLWKAVGAAPPERSRIVLRLLNAPIRRIQRREFFRMDVRMPLVVDAPAPTPAFSATGPDLAGVRHRAPIYVFPVQDLSGGGCLCLDGCGFFTRGALHDARILLDPPGGFLPVRVQVVRRTRSGSVPAAGLRFVELQERDRERIQKTLFEEYQHRRSNRVLSSSDRLQSPPPPQTP